MLNIKFSKRGLRGNIHRNMLLISSIPIFLIVFGVFIEMAVSRIRTLEADLESSAYKSVRLINSEIESAINKSHVIVQNPYLVSELKNNYESDIERMMGLYDNLDLLLAEPENIRGRYTFVIYPFNNSLYEGKNIKKIERINHSELLAIKRVLQTETIYWLPHVIPFEENAQEYKGIRFYRYIRDFGHPIALLECTIDLGKITRMLNSITIPSEAVLTYQDAGGTTWYTYLHNVSQTYDPPTHTYDFQKKLLLINGHQIILAMYKGHRMLIIIKLFFLFTILIVFVSAIIYYVAKLSTSWTLSKFTQFLDDIKQDDVNLLEKSLEHIDDGYEIAIIKEKFRDLVVQIKTLHEEATAIEIEKSRFELDLLQERINPHLLYNSLSAIKWTAQWHEDYRTSDLIDHMTSYYRVALNKGSRVIRLYEELEMIKDYIKINEISYKKSYDLKISIEEEMLTGYTFKHLLQPIIENAILHGLNGIQRKGEIHIKGYKVNEILIIEVEDNGVGIPDKQLQKIMNGDISGYGIKNLKNRIKLYFGENCGMSVTSRVDKGTTFILRIKEVNPQIPSVFH